MRRKKTFFEFFFLKIIQGDFFDENFRSILNSGKYEFNKKRFLSSCSFFFSVIFVNNKLFSNDKNQNLKLRFYDLQSGSRIISTRPFGEPHNRVTARNINGQLNILNFIQYFN